MIIKLEQWLKQQTKHFPEGIPQSFPIVLVSITHFLRKLKEKKFFAAYGSKA